MEVTIEETGPCKRTLNIEVPADTVKEELGRVAVMFKSQVNIPGFRKGSAPDSIVRSKYAKEITEEARDQLVPKIYQEALSSQELDVVTVTNVSDVIIEHGQPMTFTVDVEVRPKFSLPEYKGIALAEEAVDVKDEAVQETIDRILEQHAKYEDVEGREVAEGDLAQVDFEGTFDGKALEEIDEKAAGLGKADDFWVRTDDDSFIPGLAQAVIGKSIGDTVEFEATFPDDFGLDALSGKSVNYTVSLKAIKEKQTPEIDEEMLKLFQVDSEDELRNRIKEDLTTQAKEADQGRLRDGIADFLLENTDIDVPETQVTQETKHAIQSIVSENMRRGIDQSVMAEKQDEIFDNASEGAKKRVKLNYIMTHIAQENEISIDDDDVELEIARLATMYGTAPKEIRKQINDNNSMPAVKEGILIEKTYDFILENAKLG